MIKTKTSLTDGSILKGLFIFSLPMIVVNILQMLFHMMDTTILGILSGDAEVAAVGACGSIISMLTCFVMGYSSASNVIISRKIGAKDVQGARRASGTAVVMGLLSGVLLMVIVLISSKQLLVITNCQPEVLDMANLYMQIYFVGMPITMLYNFVASILRASGDSVSPMIYMIISGVINVGLNILFITCFNMTVSGVAFATVISNLVALVLALIKLSKNKDYCKIELKNLRLRKEETFEIIKIGVPSCIIGISFYFGEVVVISAVNSISENAMTANAISSQIDRINYTVGSSIATAVGIMISQNFGANQFDRIKKIMRIGVTYNILVTTGVGLVMLALSGVFFNLLTDSQAVIKLAKGRLVIITLTNFVTTTMEVYSNAVRALKRPRYLLIVGIVCGLMIRSCWTWFVWPLCKTFPFLFACLPISTLVGTIIYLFVYSKTLKYEENNAKTAMLI